MRGMLGGGGRGWRNCLMIDNDDELFGMIIVVFLVYWCVFAIWVCVGN